ncbi:hypothetical protein WJX72_010623 [[Myrmecia] bisecta]|uniref:U3 small nucleolar RNA-associated protein 14 n=1 Tax=[Myrmecia] bisecta TaxID=41462 RepID=A0AAW1P6D8_9CHLO
MGKPKRDRRARRAEVDKNDVYEAEELVPDEEKHAGQRYDNVESYEYELPAKFEDEEIDEDLAFTEEDKKKYGAWFGDEEQGDGAEASDKEDGLLQSDEEAEEEPNPDDYSEEEDIFGEAGADLGDAEVELDGQSDEEGAEEEDEAKHQAMLDAVRGKDVQRRKRREVVISEAYPESEYNLQPSVLSAGEAAAGELTIADLVGGLGDSKRKLGAARKTLEKLDKKAEPVAAPLPGPIRQRQERKAGYEATGKEVTKWQPVVKANREAPTIRFTSGREDIPKTNTTAAMASSFKPETDMEAEVAALLQAAGAHTGEAVEQQEEALALKSLTVEEAKERRARLAQMRTLLFFHEAKAKRMKAIKSKDYHRRTNRAAKRKAEKAGDTGDEDIIRLAAENAEFKRAQERLTLKHKNTSKWARRALKRGIDVMDEGTKAAVTEQLRLGEELRRKVDKADDGSESDSESDGGTSASEGEGEGKEPAGYAAAKKGRGMSAKAKAAALDLLQGGDAEAPAPTKGLFALPFMARAIQRQKAKAEEEAREMLKQIEREDAAAADCDAEADASDGDEDARPVRGRRMFGGSEASQPAQNGSAGGQQQQKQPDSARDSGDEDNMQPLAGTELTQRQLISRAFAGDDVEAEFAAEKAAEVAEELPDIETPSVMPGWGAWAGQAREPRWMQDARTKAQKAKEKAAGNRKDAKLKAVMISERWDKKASKYSTASVPFPFDSRETYERSIRQPMGRDFNTDSAFRDFTRPAILKSTGVIIEPLKYSKPLADEDAKLSKLSNAKRAAMAVVAGGRLQQVKRRKTK